MALLDYNPGVDTCVDSLCIGRGDVGGIQHRLDSTGLVMKTVGGTTVFSVVAATGVATVTGDLTVTGTVTPAFVAPANGTGISIKTSGGTPTFVVTAATGAVASGPLAVTGAATVSTTLGVTGVATFTAVPVFSAGLGAVSGTSGSFSTTLGVTGVATLTAQAVLTGGASVADHLTMSVAAKGLVLKRGGNGLCGTFTMTTGVATVSTTAVAATDAIVISMGVVGGTVGVHPNITTLTAGVGFTVAGTSGDTSTYNWAIIKNAA